MILDEDFISANMLREGGGDNELIKEVHFLFWCSGASLAVEELMRWKRRCMKPVAPGQMTSLLSHHLCQAPQPKPQRQRKCLKEWSNAVRAFFFRLPGWKSLRLISWTLERNHLWYRFYYPSGNCSEPVYAMMWFCGSIEGQHFTSGGKKKGICKRSIGKASGNSINMQLQSVF